jgi:hypothetical protein
MAYVARVSRRAIAVDLPRVGLGLESMHRTGDALIRIVELSVHIAGISSGYKLVEAES